MANEMMTTVRGNLTDDPTLRYAGQGRPVSNFTVAHTPRVWSREEGKWVDGETFFMRCTAWGDMAEHIAESCAKGTRVVATGALSQRRHEDKMFTEMTVEELGVSLLFRSATVQAATTAPRPARTAPAAAQGGDDGWGGLPADEPPF